MKRIFAVALVIALAGCTDEDGARRALEGAGYTNITLGGYAIFSCSQNSDQFATKFEAIGPTGGKVTGAVCSGWLKGSTIRTD